MRPMTFDIQLTGWKAWAAIAALVLIGFGAGVGATWKASTPPYRNAEWDLIDQSNGDCVYAQRNEDRDGVPRNVFASYDASVLNRGTSCPRNSLSMVIINGEALLARDVPE